MTPYTIIPRGSAILEPTGWWSDGVGLSKGPCQLIAEIEPVCPLPKVITIDVVAAGHDHTENNGERRGQISPHWPDCVGGPQIRSAVSSPTRTSMSILCRSGFERFGYRKRRPAVTIVRVVTHASSSNSSFLHAGRDFKIAICAFSAVLSVSRARTPIWAEFGAVFHVAEPPPECPPRSPYHSGTVSQPGKGSWVSFQPVGDSSSRTTRRLVRVLSFAVSSSCERMLAGHLRRERRGTRPELRLYRDESGFLATICSSAAIRTGRSSCTTVHKISRSTEK